MSVAAGVRDAAMAVHDKIVQTKVRRYWPGMAPEWAAEADDDDLDLRRTFHAALDKAFPRHEDADATAAKDDRLLAEIHASSREELPAGIRSIRQAEVVPTVEEEEDEEAQDERRRRIRERHLQREREEVEELLSQEEEEPGAEDEDESEYDTDSEDEAMVIEIVKPVFLPKPLRDTITERERIEGEERHLKELAKKKMEDRNVETRMIVLEEIRKEEQIEKTQNREDDTDIANVDTDDEVNESEEYGAWKNREIARIKRGKGQREAMMKRKEIEKPVAQPKQKWKFMQKYYHKGAFFQDSADDVAQTAGSDDIYMRDFSAATGEDKMDKSILPKVMQVKNFGRSGRVKWTGLVNEDTTDLNNPLGLWGSFVHGKKLNEWLFPRSCRAILSP